MSQLLKVVFDTQIFLRAIINYQSGCGRLVLDMQSDYELFTTDQINAEVLNVLQRPSSRAKFPQISEADVRLIEKR